MSDALKNDYRFCTWNMNGLARWKFEHPEFMRTLENNDLICITETWMNKNDCKLISAEFECSFKVYFFM